MKLRTHEINTRKAPRCLTFQLVGPEHGVSLLKGCAGPHKFFVVHVRIPDRLVRAEGRRARELGGDAPEGLAEASEQLESGKTACLGGVGGVSDT